MLYRAPQFLAQFNKALKSKTVLLRSEFIIKSVPPKPQPTRAGLSFLQKKPITLTIKLTGITLTAVGYKILNHDTVYCGAKFSNSILKHDSKFNWKKLLHYIYLDIWRWLGAIAAALVVAYINIKLPLCLGDVANFINNLASIPAGSSNAIQGLVFPVAKLIAFYFAQFPKKLKGRKLSLSMASLIPSSFGVEIILSPTLLFFICWVSLIEWLITWNALALGTLCYISLLSNAGEKLAVNIKYDLYQAIIKQDMAFFDLCRTGELVDCLFADVQEFKSSFKQCVSQGLKNAIQICGCMASLYNISPKMTLAVSTIVPVIIMVGSLFGMLLRKISKAAQDQSVKVFTMSEEVLGNIRTVRSFSNESLECKKFDEELEKNRQLNVKLGFGIALFQAGTNLFLNGLVLGTLYVGSNFVRCDELSPGQLMAFLVTAQMIQKSFSQLSLTFGHVLKGKEAFIRISYYTSLKPTIPSSGGIKIPYHAFVPIIEFKHVSFAYPTRPSQTILHDLNLVLPAGKTVAVVGASGNGKSTIALLLERFYDLEFGSITINDIDIKKLDPQWLRGTVIGIISQEPVLFATTIKENIKYGKPDATDEEIYEAAKQANADSFIRSFPDGYETVVGERGVAVSGGQKQRIAIARALIKKPSILILDEATSALDSYSEKVVQDTLEKACVGKTVLIIAHRLSTVRNADYIAVLNKGVITEMGTHESLMKGKGAYYQMVMQQKETPASIPDGDT